MLGPGSFYHDKLVMDIASTVLQIVTPETILEFKNSLPHQLTRQYLNEQEHFDLSRVLLQTTTPLSRASNGPQSSTADVIRGVDFGAALDATQYR